ncbi:hypothetical protein [Clostridium saccharoperbutylacetonicum]|uniref:hypothetical protein n=1 Tax=Clostridium saccharoperbutylacetonicum TaxID=36745 RepID=UPI0009839CCB|nr:hypothetical protein [Clostridium saccharoperbutylacetonicum]AQR92965.1 hypothetical protein CLSAP_02400 [Clostridium saccharoperbutylacetonicum]NSB34376.1 YhgE/Pip-like protein [Clostridium saccharoperbutylacetonicum]
MKGKLKPVLLIAGVIILTSVSSFLLGKQVEEKKTLLGKQVQNEESTQIAVVNQDVGTNYKDKSVNYASDLIKSLDNDFVLTNRDAGKSGLEDGKYGAMVIIPGNFSQNITTINEVTPSKVEVYYETNDKLSEENKLKVTAKVSSFEKKLNSKLSYMYLSSVFNELHQGQDYVSDILKNDNTDLDAINSINDADILETINLTQLESQNIDIKDLDLNKNFEENKKIINEIDEKYRDRLLEQEEQFNGVKNELLKVTGNSSVGIKSFRSKIQNMTPEELRRALSKRHNYNYGVLSRNNDVNVSEVNEFIEDFTKKDGYIDDLVNKYNQNVLAQVDEKGKNAIGKANENLDKVKETTDFSKDTLENSTIKQLKSLRSNIVLGNDPKLQSLNEEYLLYGEMIKELRKSNPGEFDRVYNNVVVENKINYSNILKDLAAERSPGNTFANGNDLKTYITNIPVEQKDSFVLDRSSKYKNANVNALSLNGNVKTIDDVIGQINSVNDKLKECSTSTNNLQKDSDYEYISNLFTEDTKKTLDEKLKLNESLVDEIKDDLTGKNKKSLISTMQTNNTKNVESVKDKVEAVVEKTVADDGPIDVNQVLKIFDENYVSRFDDLIKKVENLTKTPKRLSKDKEISELWDKYNKANEDLNKAVTKQLDDYGKAVETSNDEAEKHVTTMQEDLNKGIQASQSKLSGALQDAKETKEGTANSNKEKLNSLAHVLSNSRVGTVENTDMYNFMINPVSTIKTENLLGKVSEPAKTSNYDKDIEIFIFVILSISTIAIGLSVRKRKKNIL